MVAKSGSGWRLAPSIVALFDQADARAPNRRRSSDGSIGDTAHSNRTSDHNPSPEGWVCAGDISHDPAGGFDAHAFAEMLRVRRDVRVKYVICNRRMFASYSNSSRAAWTWGPYSGSNAHSIHTHVSVLHTHTGIHDTRSWFTGTPAAPPKDVMTPAQEAKLNKLIEAVGTLREHEKAHYDAVQAKVRELRVDLDAVRDAVDPDVDLSTPGSDARKGVRYVIGLALNEDFHLDARLSAIEAALGVAPPSDG